MWIFSWIGKLVHNVVYIDPIYTLDRLQKKFEDNIDNLWL